MNGGRVWAWGSCNRPGNIEMRPGRRRRSATRARPCSAAVKPKVALDPGDPVARSRRRLAARGSRRRRSSSRRSRACVPNAMTLQPGVYYSGDEFSDQDQRLCDNVTLSPGVYYLDFPAGDDIWRLDKNVTGPMRRERPGRADRVRRPRAHRAVRHAHDPVRPQRDDRRPVDRALRPEVGHRRTGAQTTLRPTWRDARRRRRQFAPLPATITTAAADLPAGRNERERRGRRSDTRRLPSWRPGSTDRDPGRHRRSKLRIAHQRTTAGIGESHSSEAWGRARVHRSPSTPATDHGPRDEPT